MKLFFSAVLFGLAGIAAAQNDEQAARYQALIAELRCLVCQNQTIAESNAPLAADLREQVRMQIESGRSDAEIIEFVTARYGDFVLYRPPFKPSTWLLWLGPFAVLVLAALIAVVFVRRSRRLGEPDHESGAGVQVMEVPPVSAEQRFPGSIVAAVTLGLFVFAGIWYVLAGSWRTQVLVDLARTNPAAAEQAAFEDVLARLQNHVKDQPDDAEGWVWLARSYMKRERYPEAAAALARANELSGGREPDWLVEEGEALAYAQQRTLSGAPQEKLEAALALAPDHPRALWFLGLTALHAGDDRTALKHWERLLKQELPGQVRASLEHSLAELRQRSGIKAATETKAADRPLQLNLEITVAPALLPEVRAEHTLFVYAQAAGEGNMPLAVRRFAGVQFPLQVTLDDSHSMVPARKLSSAQRWRLVARLSPTGNAMPQAGDLEGELLLEREHAAKAQALLINRRRP